jgi:hypothetical protein
VSLFEIYFTLGGFGHLGGPIMGGILRDLLLNSWPLKRTHPIQLCADGYSFFHILKSEVLYVHIIAKQGGIPTSEGCIPTSERLFTAKQGKIRKNKPSFCTNQHVPNTKFALKCAFCLQNALFWQLLRYLLLPNLYTRRHGVRKRVGKKVELAAAGRYLVANAESNAANRSP